MSYSSRGYLPSPALSTSEMSAYYDSRSSDYARYQQQLQQQQQQQYSRQQPSSSYTWPMTPSSSTSSHYSPTSPSYSDDYYPPPRRDSGPAPPGTIAPEYFCLFNPCRYTCARKADLERHVLVTHNRDIADLVDCDFPGCHRRGMYGFTRKDKMRDHKREVHKVEIPKRNGKRDGGY